MVFVSSCVCDLDLEVVEWMRRWIAGSMDRQQRHAISVADNRHICHVIAMKADELIDRVPAHGVFRTGQLLSGLVKSANVARQLDRWCKSGRVLQLRRGVYALAAPYVRQSPHPFLVANVIKRASYVSLQSALSHYGMIPEYVPTTTSITTGRPERLDTPLGRFIFRHTAKRLFDGFHEIEITPEQPVLIASPEKAIVDLLYLTPGSDGEALLRELRITPHPNVADGEALSAAAEASGSRKVERAVKRLIAIWREDAE